MPTFFEFLSMLGSDPLLAVTMLLIVATIFVNGATDAANSIADAVGTHSLTFHNAVIMAVIANFIGLVLATVFSGAVADTISHMVDFGGNAAKSGFINIVQADIWSKTEHKRGLCHIGADHTGRSNYKQFLVS